MIDLVKLLKKYEPENYKIIISSKNNNNTTQTYKDYRGCSGQYPNHYGIDQEYWNLVLNADELDE